MEEPGPPPPPPGPRRGVPGAWRLALAALVAVLAVLPFLVVLQGEFLAWDDRLAVPNNPHLHGLDGATLRWLSTSFYMGHYMPVTWLTLAVDRELWGLDPFGFHLTSLVLHAANAVLVLLLAARLLAHATPLGERARWLAAGLSALLFALHPLRTEPVGWITGRNDLLAALFLLACVLLYLRAQEPGRRRAPWLVLATLAFGVSLTSKASGMTLPVALLWMDLWPLGRFRDSARRGAELRRAVLEKVPMLALSAAAAGVAMAARRSYTVLEVAEYDPLRRLMQAAAGLALYPIKTLLPLGLSPLYELRLDFDPLAPAYVAVLVGVSVVTVVLVLLRRRFPALLAAWGAYVILVAPVTGVAQSGVQAAADRYAYTTCVPLAILAAGALARFGAGSRPRAVGATLASLALLGALATLSRAQSRVWVDSEALWRRVVEVDPEGYRGHWMLGVTLHRAHRFEEAIERYREALRVRGGVDDEEARFNLALSQLALGRDGAAERSLLKVLQTRPTHLPALQTLRGLYEQIGRPRQAELRLVQAVQVDPAFVEGWLELCDLLLDQGRFEDALVAGNAALQEAPDEPSGHARVGLALLYLERFEQAERALRRALELAPDLSAVRVNLGVCLERQGRFPEARAVWTEALARDPTNQAARRRLEALDEG